MISRLLQGRYQIIKPIGEGGFGKTFLAEDTYLPDNSLCAIKQLKFQSIAPDGLNLNDLEKARERFYREAEGLKQLGRHPQIPTLFDSFEDKEDKECYLVQEFIEGHNLSAELQPGQLWCEFKVISFLSDVLKILEFVHRQKQIHRDIKPDNLIRRQQDDRLVLIDFGGVKDISEIEGIPQKIKSTMMVGTPGYRPSEQAQGTPKPCSDIYAVGIIGIQALAGISIEDLKEDPDTAEIAWKPPSQVNAELVNILKKMVLYDFRQRYQSTTEVLEAIDKLAAFPVTEAKQLVRKNLPLPPPTSKCKAGNNSLPPLPPPAPRRQAGNNLPLPPPPRPQVSNNSPLPTPGLKRQSGNNLPAKLTSKQSEVDNGLIRPPILVDRYEIIETLGSGSFGKTYLAKDIKLPDKPLRVIKQFKPANPTPLILQDARDLFKTEVEKLVRLGKCDRIPQVLNYFEANEEFYLVQEFIYGECLSQEIRLNQQWNADRVLNLVEEILEILKIVHQEDIVHGNINPRHFIRRQKDRELVLIDFGGIKRIREPQFDYLEWCRKIGDTGYIPLEQMQKTLKFSADIYAVGMIALQAITGLKASQLQQQIDPNTCQVLWQDKVDSVILPELAEFLDKMVQPNLHPKYYSALEAHTGFEKLLDCWLTKGYIFRTQNRFEDAINDRDKLINIMPEFYRAWYKKGRELEMLEKFEEAMECFKKVLSIKPKYYKAIAEIGYLFHQWKKDYEKALAYYEQAISIAPEFERAWYYKGMTLAQLCQYEDALESYEKALEIQEEYPDVYYGKGKVLAVKERYQEAIIAYDIAISKKGKYPEAWYEKGQILEKWGNYDEAFKAYRTVTEFQPYYYEAWYGRGNILEKLDRKDEAINAYKKVLEINPNFELAIQKLEFLEMRKQGRSKQIEKSQIGFLNFLRRNKDR